MNVKRLWKVAINLNTEREMRESRHLKGHGNNIMRAVSAIIESLVSKNSPDKLVFTLGARHVEYGAKVEHINV